MQHFSYEIIFVIHRLNFIAQDSAKHLLFMVSL